MKSIGLPQFTCSVGIDFGEIRIVRVGIQGKNQFTLIGNTVNTSAELVDIAPVGNILLGHNLFQTITESNQAMCKELVHPSWNWELNGSKYKLYRYNGRWENYPL